MRFTRPEKAGNPDAISGRVVFVGVEKLFDLLLDLVRQNIFLELDTQARLVVCLDDAFNRTVDGLLEYVA